MPRLVILFSLALMLKANAQAALCRAVSDEKLRLECYDRATASSEKAPSKLKETTNPKAGVSTEMSAYTAELDQRILKAGITMNVSAVSQGTPGLTPNDVAFPMLLFFGYFDRATVYAITTKLLNSFADARSKGFLTVEFQDKGSNGVYRFDLRKPPPICARDLCF